MSRAGVSNPGEVIDERGAAVSTGPVFVGTALAMSLAAISQTSVSTALPTIVGDLGGYSGLSWVVSAYLLTSAIVVPFAGKLADNFGATRLFRVAIAVFAIGSLLCGLSATMWMLIIARGIQGLGAGSIMTLSFTLVARVVPPRELGRYQSRIAALFAVTSVIGPLIGGFFVDHLTWRWAFFTVTVLSVVVLVAFPNLQSERRASGARADVLGAILLVFSVISLMLVAGSVGPAAPWKSPRVAALLVIAIVGLIVFVRRELKFSDPLVPVALLRQRSIWAPVGLGFVSGISMFGVIVYATLFLQVAVGRSATQSGLLLVPLMGCVVISSSFGGRVMSKSGRFRALAILGSALMVVGTSVLVGMSPTSSAAIPSIAAGLVGLGLGLLMPVTLVAVQNEVDPAELGQATSLVQFTRKMGSTLGVALLGGVFAVQAERSLRAAQLPAGTTLESVLETPDQLVDLPDSIEAAVRNAVASGTTTAFGAALLASAVGLVFALLIPSGELRDVDLAARPVSDDLPPLHTEAHSFGKHSSGGHATDGHPVVEQSQ